MSHGGFWRQKPCNSSTLQVTAQSKHSADQQPHLVDLPLCLHHSSASVWHLDALLLLFLLLTCQASPVLCKDLQLSCLSCGSFICIFAMATCEYEMLRQQKIADNRKRMESLGLQKVPAHSDGTQYHQTKVIHWAMSLQFAMLYSHLVPRILFVGLKRR